MPSETAKWRFRRHFCVPRFVFIMAEGFQDCGVVGNDGSGISLRPPAPVNGGCIKNAV
ncbi:hypothetical protein [Neisseria polysaccharea]|uniref:hypothetical protein n=1 Tax=Neisseria polysaccharea TaxID=489 RepID=UPI0002D2D550|nr:hypothetical protein [Neisseria polysaccharea]